MYVCMNVKSSAQPSPGNRGETFTFLARNYTYDFIFILRVIYGEIFDNQNFYSYRSFIFKRLLI